MLTSLSTGALLAAILTIVVGATILGILAGRALRHRREEMKEPLAAIQAALIGFVALLLAFGLTMAVGRYEARRDAVVDDANTIGTTYLRAQTLAEPVRTSALGLLRRYTDERIALTDTVPDSDAWDRAARRSEAIQRRLWTGAGVALDRAPDASAPRLYVETLNEMIDQHTRRIAAVENRIPTAVLLLQIGACALAVGVLGMYLAAHDRGVAMAFLTAGLVTVMLFVIFDLDRPHRGLIEVSDSPLRALRVSMEAPPAAAAPTP